MADPDSSTIVKAFPVKPKLKRNPRTPKQTRESKHWSSFKPHEITNLVSSIPSLTFSPSNPNTFSAPHSASLTFYNTQNLSAISTISAFSDVVSSSSFRSDGLLIAAADLSGLVQVFDVKTRTPLRKLRSHSRPVRFVKYPSLDKLHLISGGDDSIVKYWDVAGETPLLNFYGHKDYVRSGDCSPVSNDIFITGSYDHTLKLWDVRNTDLKSVMEVKHGKPIEDVIFLPSGGLIVTAGGNSVKIWDLIGGGKLVGSMESHNKTVTSICIGKIGKDIGQEESDQFRLLSVGLDGYMKVFDYSKMKVTHSMRFPAPLMSIGFSPDSAKRVIGTSNGVIYVGKRKVKETIEKKSIWKITEEEPTRVLRSSYFRYFQRGQSEKSSGKEYLIMKRKKVKLAQHDKLLKKFMHKEALVSVLSSKNPEDVVAVIEELILRRKLMRCVSNLDLDELGLMLVFLGMYCTVPRHAGLLMALTRKVVEIRREDISGNDVLMGCVRNLKRCVKEEMRIQEGLEEIRGIVSPLIRIAGKR